MAENSKIQWTTHTFNPWRGCTKVSPGCAHCYAETLSSRNPKVLGMWGPNGTRVLASDAQWREPLKWNRAAMVAGKRDRVFCASLADVFEEWNGNVVDSKGNVMWARGNRLLRAGRTTPGLVLGEKPATLDDVRYGLFRLIHETAYLDWLLLTKRPENIVRMMVRFLGHLDGIVGDAFGKIWRRRVWLGTSIENQKAADERIPELFKYPAAVRFLSIEPLLGPVDLSHWLESDLDRYSRDDRFGIPADASRAKVDWVIVGGESGRGARPCNVGWIRSIVEQCKAASVPVFVKQLGSDPITEPGPLSWPASDPKGGDPDEWPADLRIREFPGVPA